MELLERQKAVADAILLERAAEVLKRRYPGGLGYDVAWLEHFARLLRESGEREAESGG